MDIKIVKVKPDKNKYLDLLLDADEQEDMIDRYLSRGEMFLLYDGENLIAECVVTKENDGVYEIKNIAVYPQYRKKGYARILTEHVFHHYSDCKKLYVGTGDSPLTIPFYKKCGFKESHRIKNFFTDNYDHPIFEEGIQLQDMVYLVRSK